MTTKRTSKALRLADLIDHALTPREQAKVIARMRASVLAEEQTVVADRHARAAAQRRRKSEQRAAARRKARLAKIDRLEAAHALASGLPPTAGRENGTAVPDPRARLLHAELERSGRRPGDTSIELADREARAAARLAHHAPGRAAFWALTGPAPECAAGDTVTASVFYRRVLAAIEQGGWTHSERSALYDLEQKWGARARGDDPRFMLAGTRSGRLPRTVERTIAAMRRQRGRD